MVIQEVSFRQEVLTFTAQSRLAAAASPCECSDSVSISPEARSATKADALVAALDADKDGGISDEEFVDGGTALLRRAAHARRSEDDHSDAGLHRGHGHSHRFERRLERAFDKVDANGDGSLDVDELTAAFSGAVAPRQPQTEEPAAPPTAGTPVEGQSPAATAPAEDAGAASPAPSVVSATFTFTFVSIAVRQYQVSDQNHALLPRQLDASA